MGPQGAAVIAPSTLEISVEGSVDTPSTPLLVSAVQPLTRAAWKLPERKAR